MTVEVAAYTATIVQQCACLAPWNTLAIRSTTASRRYGTRRCRCSGPAWSARRTVSAGTRAGTWRDGQRMAGAPRRWLLRGQGSDQAAGDIVVWNAGSGAL